MTKFYMKLYEFLNSIANYFWKKALQPKKERGYHGTNTETKKVTKGASRSNSKKSKKR
tara:strand:- start:69 stop:242 length:174 start_codon:yes stop_codon:yes gene_type:complete